MTHVCSVTSKIHRQPRRCHEGGEVGSAQSSVTKHHLWGMWPRSPHPPGVTGTHADTSTLTGTHPSPGGQASDRRLVLALRTDGVDAACKQGPGRTSPSFSAASSVPGLWSASHSPFPPGCTSLDLLGTRLCVK